MPTITRQEAVAQMVDGAIGAWFDGQHACAITLAGAAETGMPKVKDQPSTFVLLRSLVAKFGKCSEKDAGDLLNNNRNWLKHYDLEKSDTINDDNAWVDVVRAYFHYCSVYKNIELTPNMRLMNARIYEEIEPLRKIYEAWMAIPLAAALLLVQLFGHPKKRSESDHQRSSPSIGPSQIIVEDEAFAQSVQDGSASAPHP